MEGYMLGEVRIFGGNFAPRNWAKCEGQLLSISDNTTLFSLIGKTYGGNGTTTFALPDMKNRAVMGMGIYESSYSSTTRTLGETGGYYSAQLTTENLPSHNHAVSESLPNKLFAIATPGAYSGSGSYLTNSPVNAYPAGSSQGDQVYSSSDNTVMGKTKIN